eukprot:1859272-Prymnesium_polylepis.1
MAHASCADGDAHGGRAMADAGVSHSGRHRLPVIFRPDDGHARLSARADKRDSSSCAVGEGVRPGCGQRPTAAPPQPVPT